MVRYKIVGKDGADGVDSGYSLKKAEWEAEQWMEATDDMTVLVVPVDDIRVNRSNDPGAEKYRDRAVNRRLRALYQQMTLQTMRRE